MALPFPKDPKKLKDNLKRYERELRKEQSRHDGYIDDSGGKRYLLGQCTCCWVILPGDQII